MGKRRIHFLRGNVLTIIFLAMLVWGCHRLSPDQKAKMLTQQLQVVWVVSQEGASEIQMQGLSDKLTHEEITQLKGAGVKGILFVKSIGEDGEGHDKKARMVVVASEPVRNKVDLPQPDGTNVIYIQKGGVFERLPKDISTLAATISLLPTHLSLDATHPSILTDCTIYEIVREDGGKYGGTAFIWGNSDLNPTK